MTAPTLTAEQSMPVNGWDAREASDHALARRTLAYVAAYADQPLRHPGLCPPADALDRVRDLAWAYWTEIRDRHAVRAELAAMATRGGEAS